MPLETTAWDPVDSLTTPEAERAYLEAAFEEGDPALIAAMVGDIARARHDADRQGCRSDARHDVQSVPARRQSDAGDADECFESAGIESGRRSKLTRA